MLLTRALEEGDASGRRDSFAWLRSDSPVLRYPYHS